MEDAFQVRRVDRRADRGQDPHRPRRLEAPLAVQDPPQILAAHQLHHQVGAAPRERPEVEDRHDARVLEPRHDLRFAANAHRIGVACQEL